MKRLFLVVLFFIMSAYVFAESKDYCKMIDDFMNNGKYVVIRDVDNNEESLAFISREYIKINVIKSDKLYIYFDNYVDYSADLLFNKDKIYIDENHNLHLYIIEYIEH